MRSSVHRTGRAVEGPAKRVNERAVAGVAKPKRRLPNRFALREQAHRLEQASLMPPSSQAQSRFGSKKPLQSPPGLTYRPSDFVRRQVPAPQHFCRPANPFASRLGQVNGKNWKLSQMIEQHGDKPPVTCNRSAERRRGCDVKDQPPRERSQRDGPALVSESPIGPQIERPQGCFPMNDYLVGHTGRHPDRAVRRDDPGSVRCRDGDRTFRRIGELAPVVVAEADASPRHVARWPDPGDQIALGLS